jgi:hypothetical protein
MASDAANELVALAYTKVLLQSRYLYENYRVWITDAKIDMRMAFSTIRVEGRPEFPSGTNINIFALGHMPNEKPKLAVIWAYQTHKTIFDKLPDGDDPIQQVRQLLRLQNFEVESLIKR